MCFHQSRYVLGLFFLLVEGSGLDDEEEACGRTDRPAIARIPDAWHDEHDLINVSLGQVVGNSFAFPSEEHHLCKLDRQQCEFGGGARNRYDYSRRFISSVVWSICVGEKVRT